MARRDKDKPKDKGSTSDADDSSEAETQPMSVQDDKADEPANPKTDPPRTRQPTANDLPEITPPDPKDEPWPDATPPPMKPVDPAVPRAARTATIAMPPMSSVGKPPEIPTSSAPPPLALGSVEDPTHMPGPKDVPAGDPGDPAPAPGRVPSGDSRSLRRGNEFALVYRVGSCVISRTGVVGTRGQWRVVEYPTSATASSSYAKECSRFVSEGFTDYRD